MTKIKTRTNEPVSVKQCDWASNPKPMQDIRHAVFIREQQVPVDLEWDGEDSGAAHYVAYEGMQAVGTARVLSNGHIGRMAVLKPFRRLNIGRLLLSECEKSAHAMGLRKTMLHAQEHAIPFYTKLGYRITSEVFMDAGIPHKTMEKTLQFSAAKPTLHSMAARRYDLDPKQISKLTLGRSDEKIRCDSLPALKAHCQHMADQANRSVAIFTQNLEADLYDDRKFVETITRLVKRHRYNSVRILTQDYRRAEQDGHKLGLISQRLPTFISIRKVATEYREIKESYLLADSQGIVYREVAVRRGFSALVNYQAPHLVGPKLESFDEMWERSSLVRAFRPLTI